MPPSRLLLSAGRSRRSFASVSKSYNTWSTTVKRRYNQLQQQHTGPTSSTTTTTTTTTTSSATIAPKYSLRIDSARCFSSSNSSKVDERTAQQQQQAPPAEPYQSYEYPWATEPPEITRSIATKDGGVRVSKVIDQQQPQQQAPSDTSTSASSSGTCTKKAWFPFSGIFSKPKPDESTTSNTSSKQASDADDDASVISTSTATTVDTSASETANKISETLQESIRAYNDPFDDAHSLSEEERAQKVAQQKQQISTRLSSQLQPVQPTQPSYIPLATPASELATPETIITKLDNGVRIVSQETYGQVSTVGVVSELGSRYETPGVNTGVTNLLELLAFGACSSNEYPDAASIAHTLQDWGATRFVSAGREQSIHCIDILRPNVAKAVHLLAQTLCEPAFPDHEVEEAKQAILFQSMPDVTPPELFLQEALQRAAYGSHQQLGQPHFCPPEMLEKLTRQTCLEYWKTQFLHNPNGLVVGGAGVDHDQLVKMVEENFGHLKQESGTNRVPLQVSKYQGGYADFQIPPPPDYDPTVAVEELSAADKDKRLTRVAVALETGGWHAPNDLVAACVLQTLLGGGSSFSAGGPGKGMYSRLYRQVLNVHHWAESAEAFTTFHSESGLIGIAGSAQPAHAREIVQVLSEHLARLATQPVTDIELSRARNMLRCNVLTQLESRLVLFEDMARQVLTYGHRECIQETCRKIDAITAADVQRIAIQGLQNGPPTLAAVGVDISNVPRYNEMAAWFRANAV